MKLHVSEVKMGGDNAEALVLPSGSICDGLKKKKGGRGLNLNPGVLRWPVEYYYQIPQIQPNYNDFVLSSGTYFHTTTSKAMVMNKNN